MNARPIDAPHDLLLPGTRPELEREFFCRSLTNYLETQARPRLRELYDREVGPALRESLGREPGRREIADAMRAQPANRLWYAMRTASQRMSYEASAAVIERQRPELIARAAAPRATRGSLTLDPTLAPPRYLSALETHLMPGGYLGEYAADDVTAGALFDRQMTVNRLGSQGPLNDDPGVSLSAWLRARFPQFAPRRILELGCTVGHNLLPFAQAWPDAQLHGIDVSAPCLRYAHARAESLGVGVHLSQQDAESTRFEDGSFDLVFSRILMHETSQAAVPRIFAECHRLLAPGGLAFHSDAPQFDELDPYVASLRDWDTRCNNEPFMERWYDWPVEDELAAAGFARETLFRGWAPSLHVAASGVDPKLNRSGGRYFLFGAFRAG
jgi:SAM-dependent methyltransferase